MSKGAEESFELNVSEHNREKVWLDDMVSCVMAPLACLRPEQVNRKAVGAIVGDCIGFALTGAVSLNGKEIKSEEEEPVPIPVPNVRRRRLDDDGLKYSSNFSKSFSDPLQHFPAQTPGP